MGEGGYTPAVKDYQKLLWILNGTFRLDETSSSRDVKITCTKDWIQVGCMRVDRQAWVQLNKKWEDAINRTEIVLQEGR